ncbi:hypothetical protein MRX96_032828 [Rhipicephalus microplus]
MLHMLHLIRWVARSSSGVAQIAAQRFPPPRSDRSDYAGRVHQEVLREELNGNAATRRRRNEKTNDNAGFRNGNLPTPQQNHVLQRITAPRHCRALLHLQGGEFAGKHCHGHNTAQD